MSTAVVDGRGVVIAGCNLPDDFWPSDLPPSEYQKTATVLARQVSYSGVVVTPEGDISFEAGDYLVTDNPPTHSWPVKRAVFEATYGKA